MISSCWKSAFDQRKEPQEAEPPLHPTELLQRTIHRGKVVSRNLETVSDLTKRESTKLKGSE